MEWIVTIFVILAVIVVTAVVFVGWVIMLIVRGIGYVVQQVVGLFAPAGRAGPTTLTCSRERCGASNPTSARFCRRCGRMLPAESRVVSRAAMW